jgi:type IV pilus assembly protein PilO
MPRNFKAAIRDPRVVVRAILGVLLAANLVAAVIAFKPFGGSTDDLRQRRAGLQTQLAHLQAQLAETKRLSGKVEMARTEGDRFLDRYVTDRRSTFSTIFEELDKTAQEAGIKPRDRNVELNAIEGSDTLEMMSVTAGYEGTYENLQKFVNLLDRSPRFLIIESLVASPQQNGQMLTVSLKLDTFVKETPGATS